jgi:protein PET100, fungi type
MYYFGTNLDERFSVPDYWPTKEQSHTLPYDHKDLKEEVMRIQNQMRLKAEITKKRREQEAAEQSQISDEMSSR